MICHKPIDCGFGGLRITSNHITYTITSTAAAGDSSSNPQQQVIMINHNQVDVIKKPMIMNRLNHLESDWTAGDYESSRAFPPHMYG